MPQRRLGRRLEEVAQAVGGGYCRLQMPLRLALDVRGTVTGHRLGGPWRHWVPVPAWWQVQGCASFAMPVRGVDFRTFVMEHMALRGL